MFNRIGIVGFVENQLIRETVARLMQYLQHSGREFLVEESTQALAGTQMAAHCCSRTELGERCDLIVVVGGDGSMLHAARDLVDYQVPLLGVNRGRLGFLTDIPPAQLEPQVAAVLNGDYVTSERFLLQCALMRNGEEIDRLTALNDVVLQPRTSIRMIEFSLQVNDQYVYTQRSDGLIVATPTGSTAYALSGGGPILHPDIDAIGIVPINPHTLSNRPIVVSAQSDLLVGISRENSVEVQVVCDGQNHLMAEHGDELRIGKYSQSIRLIHPLAHDFYKTCRTKLHWASE